MSVRWWWQVVCQYGYHAKFSLFVFVVRMNEMGKKQKGRGRSVACCCC